MEKKKERVEGLKKEEKEREKEKEITGRRIKKNKEGKQE